jgi:protein-S-isoprenylcysteine O-methyltransferase Ste14
MVDHALAGPGAPARLDREDRGRPSRGRRLSVLLDSFARFALVGRGTPAPIAPTERLVISGLYRHVRNPMYLAVLSIIFGQALLFGSTTLLWYAAVLSLIVHAFVVLYEEPTLRRRYGAEYERYCQAVRRWRPSVGGYEA